MISQVSGWTSLHARLHRTLRQRQLLPKAQTVLIAVSGGQDSLCLTQLLVDLRSKWGWSLAIAHCDHRWRSDSAQNADHVQRLARAWNLPCYVQVAQQSLSSEEAARQWRYQSLLAIAQDHPCATVVTGHTASDRAETVFYNLVRGSGADGLQALTWQRSLAPEIALVRPLLEVTRAETAEFCQLMGLAVWNDTTNQDLAYARNRIRLEVMPYLQQHFNPQVETALAQTSELLRADVAYLENQAEVLRQQVEGPSSLNRRLLAPADLSLQRRVVRQWLTQLLPVTPGFEQVEKVVALLEAANRTTTDPFPGGGIATVEGDWIRMLPFPAYSPDP